MLMSALKSVSLCIYVAYTLLTHVVNATHQPLTTLSCAAQLCWVLSATDLTSYPCVESLGKVLRYTQDHPSSVNVAEELSYPCFVTPPPWKRSFVLSLLTKGEILHPKNSFLSMTIWRYTKSKPCLILVTHLNWHHYGAETILGLCISGISNTELHYNEIQINASFIKCFSYSLGIQKLKMPIILF